jgi:hypothetical protein
MDSVGPQLKQEYTIMTNCKSGLGYRALTGLFAGAILWTLSFAGGASAQSAQSLQSALSAEVIDVGTTITVRTNERINASNSDGRVYSGQVEQDVIDRGGDVAIPRGSNVELLIRNTSSNQVVLDLESVSVNGQLYGIQSQDSIISSQQADGLGANKRTGAFVGGGALIGAIIGAIAGGGKGAAIGGGIGAAGGAGTQLLTRGRSVNVPAESLVTFRLQRQLQTAIVDNGYSQNGQHYHPGYTANAGNTAAYQDGLQAGRSDYGRNVNFNTRSNRWTGGQQLRDYQTGYGDGYDGASSSLQQGYGSVRIGSDHNISWEGPANAQVYVLVDNNPRKLFAAGASGTQPAPWMLPGHLYVFVLQDRNGNEIAREQSDLRQRRSYSYQPR